MNIKLIPGNIKFFHSQNVVVATSVYMLTINKEPVLEIKVAGKAKCCPTDKWDGRIGEIIAQSKMHAKAVKRAKHYLETQRNLISNMYADLDAAVNKYARALEHEIIHLSDVMR